MTSQPPTEDKVKAFAEDLKEYYEDLQKLQNRFKHPSDAEVIRGMQRTMDMEEVE